VYVSQPPGFKIKGEEYMVFRLHKSKYGLKHAPRSWNKRIDSFLVQQEFVKCKAENVVCVKNCKGYNLVCICLYLDDLVVTGSKFSEIDGFKRQIMKEFDMIGLGKLTYFLPI
jgi:hypothetical protein